MLKHELIQNITFSIICAKADIDYETSIEKREHAAELEKYLIDLLR